MLLSPLLAARSMLLAGPIVPPAASANHLVRRAAAAAASSSSSYSSSSSPSPPPSLVVSPSGGGGASSSTAAAAAAAAATRARDDRRWRRRQQQQRRPFRPPHPPPAPDDDDGGDGDGDGGIDAGGGGGGGGGGDLDDLCREHIELDADDFAEGCRFLHQVALGNLGEVGRIVVASNERNGGGGKKIVNFRDYDRRTPLHIAASEGHLPICRLLVDAGGRVNRSDRWGGSPLDDAHRHRHLDCVEYLRSVGGEFGSSSQATNFISAASEGDLEEVSTLFRLGNVNVNGGDYDARTALHLAAGNGHVRVVEFLCERAGADVNAVDRWGGKPLDDAQFGGHAECVAALQSRGARYGTENASVEREALHDLFEQYAKTRGTNGHRRSLDWEDVKALLHGIGHEPKDYYVRNLFRIVDQDNNGLIDKEEFVEHSDLFLQGSPARIILVVGGPGSGKGVLSDRLVKECGVVHLSSGNMLREEVEAGTLLGKQVESIMKSGGLVSSAIMVALMQKKMKDYPGKRILLDGFPRSAENARDLVAMCGKPELALHVDCHDTVLIERILARGKTGGRADDNIHTALERIRTYHKYHQLTLDFLREEHVPIVNLDGSATAEGVWEQLRAVGRLMRKAVVQSSTNVKNGDSKNKSGGLPIPAD